MTNKEKSTQKDLHPPFDVDNCMEMMAKMMAKTAKQEERADFCADMMSGFSDIQGGDSDFVEMMSEMMASCFGTTDKAGKVAKNM
ncbi:MAG TPA: hypothetical protein VFI27_07735 [candidate division Zixibacteria bacterium]|nr:hypothetical protein [candidate division Zixibacteria bacterium]